MSGIFASIGTLFKIYLAARAKVSARHVFPLIGSHSGPVATFVCS